MKRKTLLVTGAMALPLAAQTLTTAFDSATAGPATAAALDAVTTGGTWTLNEGRGADYTFDDDGGDLALLADDSDGGNDGDIPFFSIGLDAPFDITSQTAELTFRTAPRRTGPRKGLRFTCLDSLGNVAAEFTWENGGAVTLNGQPAGNTDFTFLFPWDADAAAVTGPSLIVNDTITTLDFGTASATAATLNGATDIATIEVASTLSANAAKGLFIDELTLGTFDPTTPPTIPSFTVTPDSILGDRNVTLQWQTSDTTQVEISPDVGVVDANGSLELLVPAESLPQTFTLTATNANATPPDDVVTATVTVTERPVVAPPVLMAHWPFDGDLSEKIVGWNSVEVHGPDGFDDIEFAADVPTATSTRVSQSLHFKEFNADDHITTNFGHVVGPASRSVSFWAKTARTIAGAPFSYGQNQAGGGFVTYITTEGSFQLFYRNSGSILSPDEAVQPDTWTHFAIVFAGFSGDIGLNTTTYVNGVSVGAPGFSNGNPVDTAAGILDIGRSRVNGANGPLDYAADMYLSELVFYKGELTPGQVVALAGGADPATLGGDPVPAIQPVPLAIEGLDTTAPGTLELDFQGTEGTILELRDSLDLTDFLTVVQPAVYASGADSTVEIGFDSLLDPTRFFRLQDLYLAPVNVE